MTMTSPNRSLVTRVETDMPRRCTRRSAGSRMSSGGRGRRAAPGGGDDGVVRRPVAASRSTASRSWRSGSLPASPLVNGPAVCGSSLSIWHTVTERERRAPGRTRGSAVTGRPTTRRATCRVRPARRDDRPAIRPKHGSELRGCRQGGPGEAGHRPGEGLGQRFGDGPSPAVSERPGRARGGLTFPSRLRHFPRRDGQHRGAPVSTRVDLAPRPSSHPQPLPADGELSLAELLALFGSEEVAATSTLRRLRSSGALLRGWVQDSSRRAAGWGAVAGAPDVRGARSSWSAAEAQ
jgi:hypothetical protein